MKNNVKKAMKMAVALCMVAVMLLGTPTNALAAGYTKSYTKTFNLKNGRELWILMNNKKPAKITVTVDATSGKAMNVIATVPNAKEVKNNLVLQGKKKMKGTIKATVGKSASLYVTNYGYGNVKVKVKISAGSKIIKIKKKKITNNIG